MMPSLTVMVLITRTKSMTNMVVVTAPISLANIISVASTPQRVDSLEAKSHLATVTIVISFIIIVMHCKNNDDQNQ